MSTEEEFRGTLTELIQARYPVLLVESHEERRVLEAVKALARSSRLRRPRAVASFSLTAGLQSATDTPSTQAPAPPRGMETAAQKIAQGLAKTLTATEPTIFVFFDTQHALGGHNPDATAIRAVHDAAGSFKHGQVPHTLILVAPAMTLPTELEKVVTVVELPLPDEAEIDAVLEEILRANAAAIVNELSDADRKQLVKAALGLTLDEAENAFARAIARDRKLDLDDVQLVLKEKQQTIRKSGLLEYIEPTTAKTDVGGLENLKAWLTKRDGAWRPESHGWGIDPPKGVLITGVPGCGKSLTAKTMSSMWGLPLLRLDVGRIFSGLVGSSEQNMRGALRLAEAVAPSILWIDEIEKGFGSTAGGGDSGTSTRVFGTFLTWMQEKKKPVFVIATANKIEQLPPELLRKGRFDEIFFVDLPTTAERKAIWRVHLNRRVNKSVRAAEGFAVTDGLIQDLADRSGNFSGAEIEQAVVASLFEAFAETRSLRAEDLTKVIEDSVPLAVTQAEQIVRIREWAATRAVAATRSRDLGELESITGEQSDVGAWRGGRKIDF